MSGFFKVGQSDRKSKMFVRRRMVRVCIIWRDCVVGEWRHACGVSLGRVKKPLILLLK